MTTKKFTARFSMMNGVRCKWGGGLATGLQLIHAYIARPINRLIDKRCY